MRIAIAIALILGCAFAADLNRGAIGPDDTVTIMALNVDEISKAWRIGPSGELNLPLVGRINAAGMTADQLEKAITDRLKEYVRDPEVTVFVSDFKSHPIVAPITVRDGLRRDCSAENAPQRGQLASRRTARYEKDH